MLMHNDRHAHPCPSAPSSRPARGVARRCAPALGLLRRRRDPRRPDGESPSGEGATVKPYLPVPDGVELTTQGTELGLEESATVAYEPRQGEVAALDITVTRMDKASFKDFTGWKLSPETKTTQPYFVHAKIRNVGLDRPGRPSTSAVRRRRRQQADRVVDVLQRLQALPERAVPQVVQDRRHRRRPAWSTSPRTRATSPPSASARPRTSTRSSGSASSPRPSRRSRHRRQEERQEGQEEERQEPGLTAGFETGASAPSSTSE